MKLTPVDLKQLDTLKSTYSFDISFDKSSKLHGLFQSW